jgi:adenylate kinase
MLRAAVKEGSEFGRKAKEIMDAGELVPDDIIVGVVRERLEKDDTKNRGFILDGFPRTVAQADALASFAPIDLAIELEVPNAIVLERIASRRVCRGCGSNYSTSAPPTVNWTCDICGGEVIQRDDDTEDAIRRRLALYEEQTAPLVTWFMERDQIVIVDGLGDPDSVTARLIRAIDRRRLSG